MNKRILTAMVAWLLVMAAHANDGVYYVSGNQLVPLVETDIAITKEVLTISLCDDGFACADKADKRILRNLPYANRGYVFKDKTLQAYFNKLWWYMPDPTWQTSTADFTPHEWRLINANK